VPIAADGTMTLQTRLTEKLSISTQFCWRRWAALPVAVWLNRPAALMLSFGDPRPFAKRIQAEGVVFICQVQSRDHALQALDAGAEIIIPNFFL
jgi:NAD(P)H-dependent flavin oxidoreductase YrpB (nitropropane dioxygenase family)